MSTKYPGGIITKNYVAPTPSSASGIWTLDQQEQAQQAGIWPFGGPFNYIEDVFSTYLYTGNGSTQTITNNIDLAGKGGMVWMKDRSRLTNHTLYDTVRGVNKVLYSDVTSAQDTTTASLTAFNSDGFSVSATGGYTNINGDLFASWTFRKQPKFFDVVTFTQNGGVTVNHNLGSVPACIIIKSTATTDSWYVYHTSLNTPNGNGPRYNYLNLNNTNSSTNAGGIWINNITSTSFDITNQVIAPFTTYVAYLFASNAGGFGLTGTDNVISCGSYTQGSGDTAVTLGYEPQWVMIKSTDATGSSWAITDNMRAMPVSGSASRVLNANLSNAESSSIYGVHATATGFISNGFTSGEFIYIAIRRGPMAVPTTGTSVFSPNTWTGNDTARSITGANFSPDLTLIRDRSAATGYSFVVNDKLRGSSNVLFAFNTNDEATGITQGVTSFNMNGISLGTDSSNYGYNRSSNPEIGEFFARAPSFFDVVCYTGTGSYPFTINHNLGVAPELMIFKTRNAVQNWWTYAKPVTSPNSNWYQNYFVLNGTQSSTSDLTSFTSAPTSTTIPVASYYSASGTTYVAYLFATCAGVSKVGSYTGTGALQTVNCGFTSGARFVLIKRTDSTGDWWTYDSARGITSGNDPYLFLNSTAAEVTSTNYVDTDSTGFKVTAAAPAGLNANGGTYLFLAIA